MLKSSRCEVTFPTNGLALSGALSFQPGITAVVGRNGTGKTFRTIELWRYLLFGKKALRGPASDYKTLDAEGEFSIAGVDYKVVRKPKHEELTRGDEQLAVGADAINKKIVELLGFGLDVFDITNASVQKQSNRLTQLPPAKRKELIDEVIGLTKNEKVEGECKSKAKMLRLEADTIRENIVEPTEPEELKNYRPSADIGEEIKQVREIEQRRAQLLTIEQPQKPDFPEYDSKEIADLEAHEAERIKTAHRRVQLEAKLVGLAVPSHTLEEIEQAEQVNCYYDELARRGPEPEISQEEAREGLNTWLTIHTLERINTQVECPECSHTFTPASTVPEKPPRSQDFYAAQLRSWDFWSEPLVRPKGERIDPKLLAAERYAHSKADERKELELELQSLEHFADLSKRLAEARDGRAEWSHYNRTIAKWNEAQDELKTLPKPVDVDALDDLLSECRLYEAQQERFEQDTAAYNEKMLKVRALETEAEGFVKGAKRLAEARKEVKAHLAPSLSRIASSLIAEMTCGKLYDVVVDDDMNVSVNGQDVTTLSGAGETAANLALRLALGRTLVGGVFPVFLADEIDADADEERSEATFECLRNLKNQFGQVIIITHKPHVTADHVIDMDDE